MSKILLVEDDTLLSDMLKHLLIKHRYDVVTAYSGTEALLIVDKEPFDLLLLDLMLPGLAGEDVLKRIREQSDIPIIGLSAKSDIPSKVGLIQNGADDYLTKPFDNHELIARIEAVLRRYTKHTPDESLFIFKDLSLNTATMAVHINEHKLNLTRYEYLILKLLMSAPHKVFTKSNIFTSVWQEHFAGDDNAINVHISNLRKKMSERKPDVQYIQTVWGLGFKMHE
jgi:DNA-binding response OmpR family regulator